MDLALFCKHSSLRRAPSVWFLGYVPAGLYTKPRDPEVTFRVNLGKSIGEVVRTIRTCCGLNRIAALADGGTWAETGLLLRNFKLSYHNGCIYI